MGNGAMFFKFKALCLKKQYIKKTETYVIE